MKSKLLLSVLIFITTFCEAQTRVDTLKKIESNGSLSLGVSYSRHGSGDLNGYLVDIGYEYQLKKRFSLYNNIAFSVHSDKDFGYDMISQPTNPFLQSGPLIFVKSGIQTSPTLFYAVSDKKCSKFKIGAGPVIRFQESSYPAGFSYNSGREFNISNYYIIKGVQPKIFTVGYKFSIDYMFAVKPNNSFSLKAFYQNDTNGDLIVGFGLAYSHRVKFF